MNNYSAEAETKNVIEWLEDIIPAAEEFNLSESVRHQKIFDGAKKRMSDLLIDDDSFLKLLQDNALINYTTSNYELWLLGGFWENLFRKMPIDDRVSHIKETESNAVSSARKHITETLNDLSSLENYYNAEYVELWQLPHFERTNPTTKNMLFKIIGSYLPDNIRNEHNTLFIFNQNISNIKRMYESLTVYEFITITIEEEMLAIIDSVQRISNRKKL